VNPQPTKLGVLTVSSDFLLDGSPLRVSWGEADVHCGSSGASVDDFVALYSPPSAPHAAWLDFSPPLGARVSPRLGPAQ
jgi:hypothetical protein